MYSVFVVKSGILLETNLKHYTEISVIFYVIIWITTICVKLEHSKRCKHTCVHAPVCGPVDILCVVVLDTNLVQTSESRSEAKRHTWSMNKLWETKMMDNGYTTIFCELSPKPGYCTSQNSSYYVSN